MDQRQGIAQGVPLRAPTLRDGLQVTQPMVLRKGLDQAILRQHGMVRVFNLKDTKDLKAYTSLIESAVNKEVFVHHLERHWVPEERTYYILVEWGQGFVLPPEAPNAPEIPKQEIPTVLAKEPCPYVNTHALTTPNPMPIEEPSAPISPELFQEMEKFLATHFNNR